MNQFARNAGQLDEGWLLANVPFVSFVCDNDALYSMHFIAAGSGKAFGYKLDDFIRNKHYYAASTTHPEDQDIIDAHAEQAASGGAPVVSRYRLVQANGEPIPMLLATKAVIGERGEVQALAGVSFDLRGIPQLQGPSGLLSELRAPKRRRPPARLPAQVDAAWAASQLPVVSFFTENDEQYTVRAMSGSLEELLGYSAQEFLDAKVYKPSSTVSPEDQDHADAYIETAAAAIDARSAARVRLLDAEGELVPVLIFARGAQPPGYEQVGVAGAVLDISHVPALWGASGLLGG
ncbi:MAG: PAS domain-containing protein [Planctomycetes bacterium]|nr:PAS domain-containing protein [Planctomycetota bacterium]MCB9934343.1 PAS domain-containing protein [Planctomycetota bacterium]